MNFKKLKNARKLIGVKQNEFAKELNYDQCNFSNIENERLFPKNIVDISVDYCEALMPKLEDKLNKLREEFKTAESKLLETIEEVDIIYRESLNEQSNAGKG